MEEDQPETKSVFGEFNAGPRPLAGFNNNRNGMGYMSAANRMPNNINNNNSINDSSNNNNINNNNNSNTNNINSSDNNNNSINNNNNNNNNSNNDGSDTSTGEDESLDHSPALSDTDTEKEELMKELDDVKGQLEEEKQRVKKLTVKLEAARAENETITMRQESLQSQNISLLQQLTIERERHEEQETEMRTLRNTVHNMEQLSVPRGDAEAKRKFPPSSPQPRRTKSESTIVRVPQNEEMEAMVSTDVPAPRSDTKIIFPENGDIIETSNNVSPSESNINVANGILPEVLQQNHEIEVMSVATVASVENTDGLKDNIETDAQSSTNEQRITDRIEDDILREADDNDNPKARADEDTNSPSESTEQLQIQLRVLSQENEGLREVVRNLRFKYDQAIAALRDAEGSFQQQDIMVARYKQELERVAHEDNRRMPDGQDAVELRNGLLDTRLQLERMKSTKPTNETELSSTLEPIVSSLRQSQDNCSELKATVDKLNNELQQARALSAEQHQALEDLANAQDALRSSEIVVKNLEQMLESEKKERGTKEVENGMITPLKEHVAALERDMDTLTAKMKLKSTKYKYMKKELERLLNELNEMKGSTECRPVMQREIDALTAVNEELKSQLEKLLQNEAERLRRESDQKRKEEEQRQQDKEAWERRIVLNNERLYEIVNHRGEADKTGRTKMNGLNEEDRPRSAPHSKPSRSLDGHRLTQSHGRKMAFLKNSHPSSTLFNPEYINSYPEAIRTTERIQRRLQTKSEGVMDRKLTRTRVEPLKTKARTQQHLPPSPRRDLKVLLYNSHGEREGKRLLAKGDVVMINTALHQENGESIAGSHLFDVTGVVHFMGPRSQEDQDIYIGLVLDEPVGDHDGKVDGIRYFTCEAPYGKLVKLTDIISVLRHGGGETPIRVV